MKNNNFDFIKSKFDDDNITAPEILSEGNIKNIIEGKEQKKVKFYNKKSFKTMAGIAACFVLILTALAITGTFSKAPKLADNEATVNEESLKTQELSTFKSYKELDSTLKKIKIESFIEGITHPTATIFKEESKNDSALNENTYGYKDETSTETVSFGTTYKQIDNVDESDIIKNNGKYIFWLDSLKGYIYIYEGEKLVSTIKDFDYEKFTDGNTMDAIDFYVTGDKLIVNCHFSELRTEKKSGKETIEYYDSLSGCCIYDIGNINKPKLLHTFKQSGWYVDSRMVGNTLYIISNHSDGFGKCKYPYICFDEKNSETLPCDCIYYPENPKTKSFLLVSAIDVEKLEQKTTKSKAFLGYSETIYCTDHSLYITSDSGNETDIFKAELKGDNITFTATGKVKGSIKDQFSMDEKDGYFRVATTRYDEKSGKEANRLYVLDEKLKKVGEISDFAKNENIKAVKYIGDMAYVITYKQTDPLFVIDLSNPKKPEIKGSVKITGFSSLLTPVDENTLLGIGYTTSSGDDAETEFEYTDGLKLVLFDISNPEKPTVLDSYSIKDAYSDAQNNHHALVVNKDMNYFAIPYGSDTAYCGDYNNILYTEGALLFRADNGKLVISKDFIETSKAYSLNTRCTYIGDKLYILKSTEDGAKISENTVSESIFK